MLRGLSILLIAMVCIASLASAGYAAESVSASALQNKEPGIGETAIGSLVADAFRAQAKTDVAFAAAGDLKACDTIIPAGKVKSEDVVAFLAYPNDTLTVRAFDGKTILDALERSVSGQPRPSLGFLQVSGLKYSFDPNKPVGKRIAAATVGGKAVVAEKTYTVAMMKSLADGALGYWKVWSKRTTPDKTALVSSSAAVENFLAANSNINYSSLDRISAAK